ncbi:MAG: protein-L-isoaspartate(D-aspartate) O-methyltransferase [Gammaproteobacteria bacterium]|nr:protein-L-isoaspartate(D-aspartate) O-methyltransferase [Gammaproteobacteria bacterium]MBL6999110.1 protein-L-isoaspartate(D-aspartate) O-methyltransferase [Gammaproteobacteria bacterium]
MNNLSSKQLQGIGMTSQRTRDRLIDRLQQRGITNSRVLEVMRNTPRHLFVDEALSHRAYEDTALPIGYGQTISQPFIVALMTQMLLESGTPSSVLEIGTGCGYQTAILAQLIAHVYSVERIGSLHQQARKRLAELRLYNVELRHTDGNAGWQGSSIQFDRIIMTAACKDVPRKLADQLNDGGEMILPYDDGSSQVLMRITRQGDDYETEAFDAVSFVPLLPGTV